MIPRRKAYLLTNALGNLVLALSLLVLALPSFSQNRALSLTQIQQLIDVHSPDDVIAQEIRTRGLAFSPTPKVLDDLQKRGAGQAIIAAIRERMPIGTLEIQAPPQSNVRLDGAPSGVTDAQGRLVLQNVPAAPHELSVEKDGFNPARLSIALLAREYKRVPVQLVWAGGYLTVRADPAPASIDVEGLGHFENTANDVPCPSGTYTITASRAGFKTEIKTVTVAAGQHASLGITLGADSGFVHSKLAEAQAQLDRKNFSGALQIIGGVLALDKGNAEALAMLATVYYRAGDLQRFQAAAIDALQANVPVSVELVHEHSGLSGDSIHPAVLTIAPGSIQYDPGNSQCKYQKFTAPLANIEAMEVTNRTTEGKIIAVVVHHLAQGTYLLHMDVRNPSKPSDKMSFSFATDGSSTVKYSDGVDYLSSRGNSAQTLTTISNVIRQAAAMKR